MHDQVYPQELSISNRKNGYRDLLAWIDLSTFRRIPWENNVPFFLLTFKDPETKQPLAVDPRGVVDRIEKRALEELGCVPYAGVEFEVSGGFCDVFISTGPDRICICKYFNFKGLFHFDYGIIRVILINSCQRHLCLFLRRDSSS
jgi:hypothetical protein